MIKKSKVLALVLAVAVAITMCPLAAGSVYAVEYPVCTVSGDDVGTDSITYESLPTEGSKMKLLDLSNFTSTSDDIVLDFITDGDKYKVSDKIGDLRGLSEENWPTLERGKKTNSQGEVTAYMISLNYKINGKGKKQKSLIGIIAGSELFTVDDKIDRSILHYSKNRIDYFQQVTLEGRIGASLDKLLYNGSSAAGNDITVVGKTADGQAPKKPTGKFEDFMGTDGCIISYNPGTGKCDLISSNSQYSCYSIESITNEKKEPQPITIKGTGVTAEKSYLMTDFQDAAKVGSYASKDTYIGLNAYGTKLNHEVEGITVENLLKMTGAKENIESVTFYSDAEHVRTLTASEISKGDIEGKKPFLAWWVKEGESTGEPLDLPKLIIGPKSEKDTNKPGWVSSIKEITITAAQPAPTNITAAGSAYVVTKAGQTVSLQKPANKKKVTIPATVSDNGVTYKVTGISASAFKGSKKVKTLIVKTKDLTKASVKGSLKGSKVKTVKVKVGKKKENKKYVKKYKKIFKKKNSGKKVRVKR